jgi:F-type H+-transporting ATPase subunit b
VELNWSTFVLEIINFLVLIWILTRFLYKPILNSIRERKANIEKAVSAAEQIRTDAEALRKQQQARLAEWEREKERAKSQLLEHIHAERTRLMSLLRTSLEEEREKTRALEERRVKEALQRAEETAIVQSGQFVTGLLARLAGPQLEALIIDLFLQDLQELPADQLQAIQTGLSGTESPIRVTSAHPLTTSLRESLSGALQKAVGERRSCEFLEDNRLMAGLRVSIGPWMLRANLQDELQFFTEVGLHAG